MNFDNLSRRSESIADLFLISILSCCHLKKLLLFAIPVFFLLQLADRDSPGVEDSQELGHLLFFDQELSHQAKMSCASCHDPRYAFTDRYRLSFNAYGDPLATNASSLLNLKNFPYWSWRDTSVRSLYSQLRRPLFSQHPIEMGTHLDSNKIMSTLHEKYGQLIAGVCPNDWNSACVRKALVSYLFVLESRESDFDRWLNQEDCDKWSPSFEKGIHVFFENGCQECHGGRDLNEQEAIEPLVFEIRPPSLRNVVMTKPYFYDGRTASLSTALRNHPKHIWQSDSSRRIEIQLPPEREMQDLLVFLHALTDTSYLNNPLYLNPHEN